MGVHVIAGDDESLLSHRVGEVVRELVGDGDRTLMVDDFDGDDYELRAVVDAAQTPPFLTDRRVVVARGVGRFAADEVAPLVEYLRNPLPSTELVLVTGGGRSAKALSDAIKGAGAVVRDASAPSRPKERSSWIEEQAALAGLTLHGDAVAALAGWLGGEAGRLRGVLETLSSTFGGATRLRAGDVAPFLGEAGSVPPWELTDAIDSADAARALSLLQRTVGAGERHPLQVMAVLHNHYTRMLRLDGSGARDEASAAALLGLKSGFQARKALDQLRRLGSAGVARAVQLLAQADLDLRGAKEWPDGLVLEVLVARLARLAAPTRAAAGRPVSRPR